MGRPRVIAHEAERGCGFRKEGGLYLMGGTNGLPCGRIPLELTSCRACGAGIKPTRGFQWIEPPEIWGPKPITTCGVDERGYGDICGQCPLGVAMPDRALLEWVGSTHYPTPDDFRKEAAAMGVSRRIPSNRGIPVGFVVGETWMLLAHRQAITGRPCDACGDYGDGETPAAPYPTCEGCDGKGVSAPGIFMGVRPDRIEKVVPASITDAEVDALREKGIEPVVMQHG